MKRMKIVRRNVYELATLPLVVQTPPTTLEAENTEEAIAAYREISHSLVLWILDYKKASEPVKAHHGDLLAMLQKGINPKAAPVGGLESFLLARALGVYPPLEVLNWIAEAFEAYWKSSGETRTKSGKARPLDLAVLLGLAPNKGQVSPFKKSMLSERDEQAGIDMARLKHLFAISTEQAAAMVAAKMELMTFPAGVTKLKEKTLTNRYNSDWHRWANQISTFITLDGAADKQKFLETFPRHCVPAALAKSYLK